MKKTAAIIIWTETAINPPRDRDIIKVAHKRIIPDK
jgi:hypothetical protein